jgi:hypothetical protein
VRATPSGPARPLPKARMLLRGRNFRMTAVHHDGRAMSKLNLASTMAVTSKSRPARAASSTICSRRSCAGKPSGLPVTDICRVTALSHTGLLWIDICNGVFLFRGLHLWAVGENPRSHMAWRKKRPNRQILLAVTHYMLSDMCRKNGRKRAINCKRVMSPEKSRYIVDQLRLKPIREASGESVEGKEFQFSVLARDP